MAANCLVASFIKHFISFSLFFMETHANSLEVIEIQGIKYGNCHNLFISHPPKNSSQDWSEVAWPLSKEIKHPARICPHRIYPLT